MAEVILKQFKNKAGKKVAGLTPEHAIYDSNGVRLDAKLDVLTIENLRKAQSLGVEAINDAKTEAVEEIQEQLPNFTTTFEEDHSIAKSDHIIAENDQQIFQDNESQRIKTFDENERSRQNTFENNEGVSTSTDGSRWGVFNASEEERKSTFETNEATRQATAQSDHDTAAADHDIAEADHTDYDTNIKATVTELAQKVDNEVKKCDETCEEMKDILDSNFAEFSIGSDGNLYVSQGSYHDATYTITSDGNLVMNY